MIKSWVGWMSLLHHINRSCRHLNRYERMGCLDLKKKKKGKSTKRSNKALKDYINKQLM